MLDLAVKAPASPAQDTPLDSLVLILLHCEGHFRVLERTLRDFQQLARQLALEPAAEESSSVLRAIEAFCEAKPSFYSLKQVAARLAVALETFLLELVANSELLATSLAFKLFLYGNVLTTHEAIGQSYNDAVESAMVGGETDMTEERVAAGCSVDQEVALTLTEGENQVVLWKFTSQGEGLMFSAEFASGAKRAADTEPDPYSVSSYNDEQGVQNEKAVAQFRTSCGFPDAVDEAAFVYGHFVAQKTGVVTLQWENASTSNVVSKPLKFHTEVVSLDTAESILKIANGLNTVDTADWLHQHVISSEITSLEDVVGWNSDDESEDGFGEDTEYNYSFTGKDNVVEEKNPMQTAAIERRAHELEEQVIRLEESLFTTKKELKSALSRVQVAEEIYKANLETITQLEFATVGSPKSKTPKRSESTTVTEDATMSAAILNSSETQPEGTPSSELERVQRLCAGFQEQCLWRSVENMELEAQLAASQVEASSWRDKYGQQTVQLQALDEQNRTLRSHKKLLVQEVKRLQPYSQVNLAALVQEAQEARMVQRSLQAKLDSRDVNVLSEDVPGSTDFVLVEASDDEP